MPGRVAFLSSSMAREANNYDLLRLILALTVIFGHAGALNPRPGYTDPVQWLIGFDYSGGLAVKVFFFLSGLFVTDSIVTSRSAIRFAVMRATRLFPGLLVCLAVSTLIVGPLFTELPVADYLRNPLTHSYIGANLALTDLQWRLPGVFATSHYGVNGSLWTIPTEVRLYIAVLALHLIGAFARRSSASLAIAIAGYYVATHTDLFPGGQAAQGLALCFLAGMAAAIHKDHLPLHGGLVLVAWIYALAVRHHASGHAVYYCALFYSSLYVFQWPAMKRIRLPGDFSYGVYLYGFVVQQSFAAVFPLAHPLVDAAVCMPVSAGIAVLSWFMVERPALSTSRRLLSALGMRRIDARPVRAIGAWAGAATMAIMLPSVMPQLRGSGPPIAASLDLHVESYGPAAITHDVAFNTQPDGSSAIWVKLSRPVAPDTEIRLGENRLLSVAVGDLVTARVPAGLYALPGILRLFVVEQVHGRMFASDAVPWQVR